MATKKKKSPDLPSFPETIYVRLEKDGDDTFLIASEWLEEIVEGADEPVLVAEYNLDAVGKATTKVTIALL